LPSRQSHQGTSSQSGIGGGSFTLTRRLPASPSAQEPDREREHVGDLLDQLVPVLELVQQPQLGGECSGSHADDRRRLERDRDHERRRGAIATEDADASADVSHRLVGEQEPVDLRLPLELLPAAAVDLEFR
jgi:hypothetical protein